MAIFGKKSKKPSKSRLDYKNLAKKQPSKQTKFNLKNVSETIKSKKQPKKRVNKFGPNRNQLVSKNSSKKKKSILVLLINILLLPFVFLFKVFYSTIQFLEKRISREWFIKSFILVLFTSLVINFVRLQVTGSDENLNANYLISSENIIKARRGNIYIRDIKINNQWTKITSSQTVSEIWFDPSNLKKQINAGKFTREEVITELSASLNISWDQISEIITRELSKDEPMSYVVLEKYATPEQGEIVKKLRNSEEKNSKMKYTYWLGYTNEELRDYPEEKTLAATLGYVARTPIGSEEIKTNGPSECRDMVSKNEVRKTFDSYTGREEEAEYIVGYFGLEQKYCSELGGLNGREVLSSEVGTDKAKDTEVVNGADLYLTIDKNLQKKAEEILKETVKRNTNDNGAPRNGAIIILNAEDTDFAKAGAILGMASWPTADPNKYYKDAPGLEGFKNSATATVYEPGSVIKPLTVASALNEWYSGKTDDKGNRIGLNPNWTFHGYGSNGKIYREVDGGSISIKNAAGRSFSPNTSLPIKDCLRLSINTCLADIEPMIGNSAKEIAKKYEVKLDHSKTQEYFEERFMFGKETLVDLPNDRYGNTDNFETYLANDFTYAAMGFGQGFEASPIQIARAYTPLARSDGSLVEPFLVEKIEYSDGEVDTEDGGRKPVPVLDPEVSRLIGDWMVYTLDNYGHAKAVVPGYHVAAKTGTAQVSRSDHLTKNEKDFCISQGLTWLDCNTTLGIYDQTFIGFGPVGPEYQGQPKVIILIKLFAAKPGEEYHNYAITNLGESFSEMMSYTLGYLGVPKQR